MGKSELETVNSWILSGATIPVGHGGPFEKRQRAAALHDADARLEVPDVSTRLWSAAALCRFHPPAESA